ncbi:MAG TPA: SPOR domain-containing protein [Malonomonas sp.]
MNAASKTRTERRMEKKQALLLLILVLVVSLASFTLGVIVGQRGAERDLSMKQQAAEQVLVAKLPARTLPQVETKSAPAIAEKPLTEAPAEETKLTFYDNLAKESSAPLGSGINLPPQERPQVVQPPISLPDKPIVVKGATKIAAVAESVVDSQPATGQPKVVAQGSYSVQVGSFAAAVDAGKLKKTLLDKGYPAFTVEADLGKKGMWYRVRLGPYADNDAARTMQLLVEKQDKIKGFITRQ